MEAEKPLEGGERRRGGACEEATPASPVLLTDVWL